MNENLTDDEIKRLEAAKTARMWDEACDAIKAARGGQYPGDWWRRVAQSGLMARVTSRF